jgi:hypothetical protein
VSRSTHLPSEMRPIALISILFLFVSCSIVSTRASLRDITHAGFGESRDDSAANRHGSVTSGKSGDALW